MLEGHSGVCGELGLQCEGILPPKEVITRYHAAHANIL